MRRIEFFKVDTIPPPFFAPLRDPNFNNSESPSPKGHEYFKSLTFRGDVEDKGHAYQVWSKLAENFQMRCRKCEKFTKQEAHGP